MCSYQGMFDGTNVRDGSYPHEAFTSDGSGGAFAGKIRSTSNQGNVDIGKPASATWEQAASAVLEGSGQGQVRRVANVTGSVYAVDRQWDVPVREAAATAVASQIVQSAEHSSNLSSGSVDSKNGHVYTMSFCDSGYYSNVRRRSFCHRSSTRPP